MFQKKKEKKKEGSHLNTVSLTVCTRWSCCVYGLKHTNIGGRSLNVLIQLVSTVCFCLAAVMLILHCDQTTHLDYYSF